MAGAFFREVDVRFDDGNPHEGVEAFRLRAHS